MVKPRAACTALGLAARSACRLMPCDRARVANAAAGLMSSIAATAPGWRKAPRTEPAGGCDRLPAGPKGRTRPAEGCRSGTYAVPGCAPARSRRLPRTLPGSGPADRLVPPVWGHPPRSAATSDRLRQCCGRSGVAGVSPVHSGTGHPGSARSVPATATLQKEGRRRRPPRSSEWQAQQPSCHRETTAGTRLWSRPNRGNIAGGIQQRQRAEALQGRDH